MSGPANLESAALDWLDGTVSAMCDEAAEDLAYSSDQMIDAFLAGAIHMARLAGVKIVIEDGQ